MWLPQQNNLDCRPIDAGIALLRVNQIFKNGEIAFVIFYNHY